MDYHQYSFDKLEPEKQEMLIALLSEAGFEGFEEQDERLLAFVQSGNYSPEQFENILQVTSVTSSKSIVHEKNWNAEWERDFKPVEILDPVTKLPFAIVRADFHAPETRLINELIVTPKMSFGTGHHATTSLVMERMSQRTFEGKDVIDFGTGTGVLAILAEKMGAKQVWAIDIDEWSITNAKENIQANDCRHIRVQQADELDPEVKADIILANINLNILLENMQQIKDACETGGHVIISGILSADKETMLRALDEHFFQGIEVHEKDGWLAIEADVLGLIGDPVFL